MRPGKVGKKKNMGKERASEPSSPSSKDSSSDQDITGEFAALMHHSLGSRKMDKQTALDYIDTLFEKIGLIQRQDKNTDAGPSRRKGE